MLINNRKVFRTPGPWTKLFERTFYRSIKNIIVYKKLIIF